MSLECLIFFFYLSQSILIFFFIGIYFASIYAPLPSPTPTSLLEGTTKDDLISDLIYFFYPGVNMGFIYVSWSASRLGLQNGHWVVESVNSSLLDAACNQVATGRFSQCLQKLSSRFENT